MHRKVICAVLKIFVAAPLVMMFIPVYVAQATDGVAEINQTCAVQTGCFPGDTAGYPVTIDGQGGRSYRLTSDLILPDENTTGILIRRNSIGIDLNQFEIIRLACVAALTDCTPTSGTGSGIIRDREVDRGTSVKNGSITGMGVYGVLLGGHSEVTNLRVRWNRFGGIGAEKGSIVSGNTAHENGPFAFGIEVGAGSSATGNTASGNGLGGLLGNAGSTLSGNTAYLNGGQGITTYVGSTVLGNTVYQNTGDGIRAGDGCSISGNTASNNTGDGIEVSLGAIVQGNSTRGNDGYGLNLGSHSAYRENVVTGNGAGTVNGGVNLLGNSCDGAATCP